MARAPMPAPAMIETPAMRRSAALAKALEDLRAPPQQIGGYGDLGARLLAQGITQWSQGKAEKEARGEREQHLAGIRDNVLGDLAAFSPPSTPAPGAALGAALTNTQEPREAAMAPVGAVTGSPLPAAAPAPASLEDALLSAPQPQAAPQPPPQAAPPQAPRNPLGPTPGQIAMITEAVNSQDPARVAWGQQLWAEIEMQMAENPALRQEFQSINGVPGVVDPVTRRWTPIEGGIPQEAMNTNQVVGAGNAFGLPEGAGVSMSPFGVPSVVGRPPEGYTRQPGGGLAPEVGGTQDLPNNPRARFEAITAEQQRLRPILDQATAITRNIGAVRAGVGANNGAGDIAAINGLQRLIDEGVVKEGDVDLQLRSQGLAGGISQLRGYLTSTGQFSPEIRAQIGAVAETLYSTQMPMIREQIMGRRDFINRSLGAGAFDDVVPPSVRQAYGWESAPAPDAPRRLTPAQAAELPSGTPFHDMDGNPRVRR